MEERNTSSADRKAAEWRDTLRQTEVGQTHTSRMMRGAARLASDLDVPADVAGVVLGAAVDAERAVVDQMLKEGRY